MKTIVSSVFVLLCLGSSSVFSKVWVNGVEVTDDNTHYLQYARYMTVPFASQNGSTWDAGNNVAGKTPAEVQAIVDAIKALESDARQREIYDRMKSTPTENFVFTAVTHAQNVVKQRMETVKMMGNFNADQRYWYHDAAHPVSTTAVMWEPGRTTNFLFQQRSGDAHAAIAQICAPQAKTYGECFGAITACVWWGASQGMGNTAFNGLYPGAAALNMDLVKGSFTKSTKPAIDGGILVPGDWLYFENYNYMKVVQTDYFFKMGWLKGDAIYYWSGENALYFGDGKYEGLGVRGKTAAEMREELMIAYNRDLEKVIKEVAKQGGAYKGMEIVAITPATAPIKIKMKSIKRVIH